MEDKEKQIEEMAEIIRNHCGNCDFEEDNAHECGTKCKMEALYNAGYRKERQGEWSRKRTMRHDGEQYCTNCDAEFNDYIPCHTYNYCPHCGAKMKGV